MTILIIFLCIILTVVLLILLSPIRIVIINKEHTYHIHWKGIGIIKLETKDNPGLYIKSYFWEKKIPFKIPDKKASSQKVKPTRKKSKKFSLNKVKKKAGNILNSFRFRICEVNIDTDDYIWNAYLTPVFYFMNRNNRHFTINYQGEVNIHIVIENRLIKILWAVIL